MVQFFDALSIQDAKARVCADGSLVAVVKAARVGIQSYGRNEVGAPDSFTGDTVKVYRPEGEVFAKDSMASYAAAPVTINHPAEFVDSKNWREHGVGEINGDIVRDGDFVRVPIIIRDSGAVEKVMKSHRQLSMGYTCALDWEPGTAPDGQAYDAVQRNIRINHIAAVPVARGGPELSIVDERVDRIMKIKIGDAEVDATNAEAVRIAVDALNAKLADMANKVKAMEEDEEDMKSKSSVKDAQIATLQKQLAEAAITPEKLRDAAKSYQAACEAAKRFGVKVGDADSEVAIKRAIVLSKMGDAAKEWSDEAVSVSYDTLLSTAAHDSKVQSLAPSAIKDAAAVEAQAFAKSVDFNSWRNRAA